MTEDRVGNIGKAIGTVMAVIIIMLAIIAHAFGQERPKESDSSATKSIQDANANHSHSHVDASLLRFRLIRIIPAKITYIEPNEKGQRIEYVAKDSKEIENGFFQKTKETLGDEPKKGEYYWFAYCAEDRHLYSIFVPTAEQLKALK